MDLKALQNGSDIRGIALEGAAGETVNLGREETIRLTAGFAAWLVRKTGKPTEELLISVGHDSRLSAETLKGYVIKALLYLGIKVYDCGLASTPAMFMSTVFEDYNCDGAVMITASHLPFNRNGFKYFDRKGGLNKEDISAIIAAGEGLSANEYVAVAEAAGDTGECTAAVETAGDMGDSPSAGNSPGSGAPKKSERLEKRDIICDYAAHLRNKIKREVTSAEDSEKPLKGLKIVVDAGNGAGGFYASEILEPLGADISASQFLEPDGTFPNHAPNPENKEAMESICEKVKESGADFGLIFDTDVDRSSAVDAEGREINRNAIVAMAAALIAVEHPGTTVVTDSITSDQLTAYLENCLGLKHLRFKRGYRNVINKAMELNQEGIDCQLAIETSGHAAYKENYFLDDGAYLATKIVIKAAQLKASGAALNVLISSLEEPKEAVEYRFPISADDFASYGDMILADLEEWAGGGTANDGACLTLVQPNYEGVRINFRREGSGGTDEGLSGWCLMRKSLHDPIMPLNIEVTKGSCDEILALLKGFLCRYDRLEM